MLDSGSATPNFPTHWPPLPSPTPANDAQPFLALAPGAGTAVTRLGQPKGHALVSLLLRIAPGGVTHAFLGLGASAGDQKT